MALALTVAGVRLSRQLVETVYRACLDRHREISVIIVIPRWRV